MKWKPGTHTKNCQKQHFVQKVRRHQTYLQKYREKNELASLLKCVFILYNYIKNLHLTKRSRLIRNFYLNLFKKCNLKNYKKAQRACNSFIFGYRDPTNTRIGSIRQIIFELISILANFSSASNRETAYGTLYQNSNYGWGYVITRYQGARGYRYSIL